MPSQPPPTAAAAETAPAERPCGPASPEAQRPGSAKDCIYVDGIEAGLARLLIAQPSAAEAGPSPLGDDWREYRLPLHVLPADLREGDWLSISLSRVPAPTAVETESRSLRSTLGASDDGGDFSL